MSEKKRKRQPVVTYQAPGKLFDRLLEEESYHELLGMLWKKLALPKDSKLELFQMRGESAISLEDEGDFRAFQEMAWRNEHVVVKVGQGYQNSTQASAPAVNTVHSTNTNNVENQNEDNEDEDAPRKKKKRKLVAHAEPEVSKTPAPSAPPPLASGSTNQFKMPLNPLTPATRIDFGPISLPPIVSVNRSSPPPASTPVRPSDVTQESNVVAKKRKKTKKKGLLDLQGEDQLVDSPRPEVKEPKKKKRKEKEVVASAAPEAEADPPATTINGASAPVPAVLQEPTPSVSRAGTVSPVVETAVTEPVAPVPKKAKKGTKAASKAVATTSPPTDPVPPPAGEEPNAQPEPITVTKPKKTTKKKEAKASEKATDKGQAVTNTTTTDSGTEPQDPVDRILKSALERVGSSASSATTSAPDTAKKAPKATTSVARAPPQVSDSEGDDAHAAPPPPKGPSVVPDSEVADSDVAAVSPVSPTHNISRVVVPSSPPKLPAITSTRDESRRVKTPVVDSETEEDDDDSDAPNAPKITPSVAQPNFSEASRLLSDIDPMELIRGPKLSSQSVSAILDSMEKSDEEDEKEHSSNEPNDEDGDEDGEDNVTRQPLSMRSAGRSYRSPSLSDSDLREGLNLPGARASTESKDSEGGTPQEDYEESPPPEDAGSSGDAEADTVQEILQPEVVVPDSQPENDSPQPEPQDEDSLPDAGAVDPPRAESPPIEQNPTVVAQSLRTPKARPFAAMSTGPLSARKLAALSPTLRQVSARTSDELGEVEDEIEVDHDDNGQQEVVPGSSLPPPTSPIEDASQFDRFSQPTVAKRGTRSTSRLTAPTPMTSPGGGIAKNLRTRSKSVAPIATDLTSETVADTALEKRGKKRKGLSDIVEANPTSGEQPLQEEPSVEPPKKRGRPRLTEEEKAQRREARTRGASVGPGAVADPAPLKALARAKSVPPTEVLADGEGVKKRGRPKLSEAVKAQRAAERKALKAKTSVAVPAITEEPEVPEMPQVAATPARKPLVVDQSPLVQTWEVLAQSTDNSSLVGGRPELESSQVDELVSDGEALDRIEQQISATQVSKMKPLSPTKSKKKEPLFLPSSQSQSQSQSQATPSQRTAGPKSKLGSVLHGVLGPETSPMAPKTARSSLVDPRYPALSTIKLPSNQRVPSAKTSQPSQPEYGRRKTVESEEDDDDEDDDDDDSDEDGAGSQIPASRRAGAAVKKSTKRGMLSYA
ncbi:hypothetical protein SISNIDRAFT_546192 [Sistotremastrum niveocremeum HHB9708]|uniref:Uncharacterized protein n=1 Tax=Sistotremastrum niveocremeum HHB9708 TaxID=1314777 RepID=A0A164ZX87_9AGAM|nr:hypothetical protein SISNIDRAFT_546192 [Sistotremastrum niveocremeum HHB9708]